VSGGKPLRAPRLGRLLRLAEAAFQRRPERVGLAQLRPLLRGGLLLQWSCCCGPGGSNTLAGLLDLCMPPPPWGWARCSARALDGELESLQQSDAWAGGLSRAGHHPRDDELIPCGMRLRQRDRDQSGLEVGLLKSRLAGLSDKSMLRGLDDRLAVLQPISGSDTGRVPWASRRHCWRPGSISSTSSRRNREGWQGRGGSAEVQLPGRRYQLLRPQPQERRRPPRDGRATGVVFRLGDGHQRTGGRPRTAMCMPVATPPCSAQRRRPGGTMRSAATPTCRARSMGVTVKLCAPRCKKP